MRVVYQLQTHNRPAQIERLVRTLRRLSPESYILISHAEDGVPLDEARLRAIGGVDIFYSRGGYGDLSHVERYLDAVDLMVARDIDFDWVCNLSAQDYPIRPLAEVEAEVASLGTNGMLHSFEVFGEDSNWPSRRAHSRYRFRHWRFPVLRRVPNLVRALSALNFVQPLVRVHSVYASVGLRWPSRLDPSWTLYGGSVWCWLDRDAALAMKRFRDTEPRLMDWFRHQLTPSEVFTQTVLRNDPALRFHPDNARFVNFREGHRNHPKTLTVEDLPEILASGAHFARKFDEDKPEVLDALDDLLDLHAMSTGTDG